MTIRIQIGLYSGLQQPAPKTAILRTDGNNFVNRVPREYGNGKESLFSSIALLLISQLRNVFKFFVKSLTSTKLSLSSISMAKPIGNCGDPLDTPQKGRHRQGSTSAKARNICVALNSEFGEISKTFKTGLSRISR